MQARSNCTYTCTCIVPTCHSTMLMFVLYVYNKQFSLALICTTATCTSVINMIIPVENSLAFFPRKTSTLTELQVYQWLCLVYNKSLLQQVLMCLYTVHTHVHVHVHAYHNLHMFTIQYSNNGLLQYQKCQPVYVHVHVQCVYRIQYM